MSNIVGNITKFSITIRSVLDGNIISNTWYEIYMIQEYTHIYAYH